MKKVLTGITEEEKELGLRLLSIRATYITLLGIDRYPLDTEKIKQELQECEIKIDQYWKDITNKYGIPMYLDRSMFIDNENNTIYVTK